MSTIIKDGTGSGNSLAVNKNNRLTADSIAEERAVFNSAEQGLAFNVLTDFLTFTGGAGVDGLLYIKNTSDKRMQLHHLKIWCGTASTISKVVVYKNPTAGTLISGATPADTPNMNFTSGNDFEGIAYQGDGSALTITDGEIVGRHYLGVGMQQIDMQMWMGQIVLEKGASIAIGVQPPSAVSVNVSAEMNIYFED